MVSQNAMSNDAQCLRSQFVTLKYSENLKSQFATSGWGYERDWAMNIRNLSDRTILTTLSAKFIWISNGKSGNDR